MEEEGEERVEKRRVGKMRWRGRWRREGMGRKEGGDREGRI